MSNPFATHSTGLEGPFRKLEAVTFGAAFSAGLVARGLWFGASGTVNLTFHDDSTIDGVKVQAGLFPCGVKLVRSGGTVAAADIWAGF